MANEPARLDTGNVREVLAALKEFSPKLATGLRRELRGVGDNIIAGQRAILDGPLPSGVAQVGVRMSMAQNKKTGKWGMVKRNVYKDRARKNAGRSSGLRAGIKAGLKTRVVAGKTRQGVTIRTTKSVGPQSILWQSKRFRHKTFGREPWVFQKGQPYFWQPVVAGQKDARLKAGAAIDAALAQLRT